MKLVGFAGWALGPLRGERRYKLEPRGSFPIPGGEGLLHKFSRRRWRRWWGPLWIEDLDERLWLLERGNTLVRILPNNVQALMAKGAGS